MTQRVDVLLIGGTGFEAGLPLQGSREVSLQTPFGPPASPLTIGQWGRLSVGFLARHGRNHQFLPHQVNYRANVYAARLLHASAVVALHAVGSLNRDFPPASILLPDQVIDYTWGREHSYAGALELDPQHVDFTEPFDQMLRQSLTAAAGNDPGDRPLLAGTRATYGVTQGPRLESAAEIDRLARDGCDVVGMTAMPEAGLARELGIRLASIATVANWAAGFDDAEPIEMDRIMANIQRGSDAVRSLLDAWCRSSAPLS